MWETDKRVEAILNSPIGCEFLSIAAAEGLSSDAIVAPRNALWLAAFATEEMTRWSPDHDANVEHALGQGERSAPLAHSVLQHPGSAWWFESLDLDHQVWIEHGKEPFCVEPLDGPLDTTTWQRPRTPPDWWERYAQKPKGLQYTSTLHGENASLLVGYDHGVGDLISYFPIKCWSLAVTPAVRVYEIHGPKDWHDLCVSYPAKGGQDNGQDGEWLVPDWGAAARDWDGVHLSLGGLLTAEQVRHESPAGWSKLDAWHAEQTFWLGPIAARTKRLPDHESGDWP